MVVWGAHPPRVLLDAPSRPALLRFEPSRPVWVFGGGAEKGTRGRVRSPAWTYQVWGAHPPRVSLDAPRVQRFCVPNLPVRSWFSARARKTAREGACGPKHEWS